MRTVTTAALLAGLLFSGAVAAQEAAPPATEEERAQPRRTIRVLQDPYDLASFYAARPGAPAPIPPVPYDPAYALASFYRSRHVGMPPGPPLGPWLWGPFWASGYGARCPTPLKDYRHSIGENGDLFLAVPFLATVGPLNGAIVD